MSHISFQPWVGGHYNGPNRFGAKVLVLGESHHGRAAEMHQEFTKETVEELGQQKRHPFFTTMAKFLSGMDASRWISDSDRAEVWDHVAFYNFVQETVGDFRDSRPTQQMWARGGQALPELLARLRPDIMVVTGFELASHLPPLPAELEVVQIRHPASGFSYARWNPCLQAAVERVTRQ